MWEYKIVMMGVWGQMGKCVELYPDTSPGNWDLNQLGATGWELVAVIHRNDETIGYLKRRRDEEE